MKETVTSASREATWGPFGTPETWYLGTSGSMKGGRSPTPFPLPVSPGACGLEDQPGAALSEAALLTSRRVEIQFPALCSDGRCSILCLREGQVVQGDRQTPPHPRAAATPCLPHPASPRGGSPGPTEVNLFPPGAPPSSGSMNLTVHT